MVVLFVAPAIIPASDSHLYRLAAASNNATRIDIR